MDENNMSEKEVTSIESPEQDTHEPKTDKREFVITGDILLSGRIPDMDSSEESSMATSEGSVDVSPELNELETPTSEEPPKLKYYNEALREEEINKYQKFKKVDGDTYRKINEFLRRRTYVTAREWAIARLCADFRTSYGSEMTFIGENLPRLCPFMLETYSPQAVNQARVSFKKKVRKSAATFLYGAMCGFFTSEELDDVLYEANEVARFILEIEGTTLEIDDEIEIEDKISAIMKKVGDSAYEILQMRGKGSIDEEVIDEDEEVVEVKMVNRESDAE